MKINWGGNRYCFFVYYIFLYYYKDETNSAYDNELVVEEYYNTMQNLQKICQDAKHEDLSQKPQIISNTLGINYYFPSSFKILR
jgi:hypothetical protein